MNNEEFDICLNKWKNSDGLQQIWMDLAKQLGYDNPERLRSEFRRMRKKLGINRDNVAEVVTIKQEEMKSPKILIIDLETSPLTCFTWGIYDQRINPDNVITDWYLFSYAAKWLFSETVISNCLNSKEALLRNDSTLVNEVWKLLDMADIVVTYNGDHFDLKRINTRFALHQLPPPSFYRSVDLYKIAKDSFSFTSNKLSFVNTFLGLEDKTHTDFNLWKRCYNGEKDALIELKNYNCNDAEITQELYLKILPWIKNHPNLNIYNDEDMQVCPKCGSKNLHWDGKFVFTQASKFESFRCLDCKTIGKGKKNLLDKEKRNSVVN